MIRTMRRQPRWRHVGMWALVALACAIGAPRIEVVRAGQQGGASAKELYQQGLHEEEALGNLETAIKLYQRIVKEFASDRVLAARALVRMGRAYEKLGNAEARNMYDRVLRDYADQRDMVAQARARLAGMGDGVAATGKTTMTARRVWAGPDVDTTGTLSPDGRYLTFTDRQTGDLAMRDLTTGETRRLTSTGDSRNVLTTSSIVSPDGKHVAYGWINIETPGRRGVPSYLEKDSSCDFRIISVSGGVDAAKPRILYRNQELRGIRLSAWSPDGRDILAVLTFWKDRPRQIAMMSVADGSVRVLKTLDFRSPAKMSLSPDGRYIAYDLPTGEDSSDRDIFLLSADGSRETALIQHPADDHGPMWSQDGARVLFVSDRRGAPGLWMIPIADGNPQRAPELVKPDIGTIAPLGLTRAGSYYYGLGIENTDIYTAEIDPESGRIIAEPARATERFLGFNRGPVWSPDGHYLAYASLRGPSVTFGPSAFNSWGAVTTRPVIRSVETGEERDISLTVNQNGPVSWFPDGRSLLVPAKDNRYRWSYYRMDPQTGEASLILQTAPGNNIFRGAAVSPDGKAIFYLHRDANNSSIHVHEIETGRDREIYQMVSPLKLGYVALSPDGRQVAVLVADYATRSTPLMIVPATGGEPREVFRTSIGGVFTPPGIAWTPDGRHVLVVRPIPAEPVSRTAELELWRIPVEGGQPLKLLTMGGLRYPNVHPDGRRIAFDGGSFKTEVWAMENFLPPLGASR